MSKRALSLRLQQVADWVLPGRPMVDVGCGDAMLPVWLVLQRRVPFALALDASKPALSQAQARVQHANVEDRVSLRLSDGLAALSECGGHHTYASLVVSGMGGKLMGNILHASPACALAPVERCIFQPQRGAHFLRAALQSLSWTIVLEEFIVCPRGHRYPVIAAERSLTMAQPRYSAADIAFGPILRRRPAPAWVDMLHRQANVFDRWLLECKSPRYAEQRACVIERLALLRAELACIGSPSPERPPTKFNRQFSGHTLSDLLKA